MQRTPLAFAVLSFTLVLVSACKHDDGRAVGITSVRGGAMEGASPRTAPDPVEHRNFAADRLAGALCRRERRCTSAKQPDVSTEAVLTNEAACVAELEPVARRSVESWQCSPAVARAGFKDCIAAVDAELRCIEVDLLGEASPVEECRPSNICRKGEGIALR